MRETFRSLDDYEAELGTILSTWTPRQRAALAAAMAERWLPTYTAFAEAEDWGDPAHLRLCADTVWAHVGGTPAAPATLVRLGTQLQDCTPHMDDFDAPAALAVCGIVAEALDACKSADNLPPTVQAVLSGFEAAAPGMLSDDEDAGRLWKRAAAKTELRAQLSLLEKLAPGVPADLVAFRGELASLRGKVTPPRKEAPSPGLTNQQAFDQYRRFVESDLRSPGPTQLPGVMAALLVVGVWAGRYSRRRQTLDGSYGKLADTAGIAAVVARNRARDARFADTPDWPTDVKQILELTFTHSHGVYDVRSPYDPHGFGPSIRQLWQTARNKGQSDTEAWEAIVAWARHRPAAWAIDDRRRTKGKVHTDPVLAAHLARPCDWTPIADPEYPWQASLEGQLARIRINDFPDDYPYTLVLDGADIGSFVDWPDAWQRA